MPTWRMRAKVTREYETEVEAATLDEAVAAAPAAIEAGLPRFTRFDNTEVFSSSPYSVTSWDMIRE